MQENKIDELIGRIMDATGITSQSSLAAALGINRSGITHARKKNQVPDKWILKLYRKFGFHPQWIETGKGQMFMKDTVGTAGFFHDPTLGAEMRFIPKVSARLCAGGGSFVTDSDVKEHLCFNAAWLAAKGSASRMVAMEVFGNSMSPEIKEGDTLLIDQSQTEIYAGAIYAVGVEDTILVKRIEKHPNKLVLCSDNRDYAPIYLERDEMDAARIIGKVIWNSREYR
ncbi:Phage repressor protein C, contains Cro/C1-type HTH and peptisase s24 domains [Desulfocicer vacuolatum DSM 3385]|uniref:Phage repressor protein C, contains Cro/C1-type HTH and peptisase s24 domains n=1 Tax=Desulfocicer vacuolatum DSM 3385 TaxID=1121400 RepID=A0A1W2DL93_9BACT|nr:helix-turn-helix transcriptional regulator [Desulfocicer vacuolatum]SMC97798.1 Phage repressor protein C, contains Cro/C1-type HTH and peptisase s24 domains [Desulfocicer vacuolatum DSM 3385]